MDKSSKIKGLIRSITGTDRPSFGFRLMEVVSVEGDLCRAKIDNLEIPDIRLSSINGGSENGLLVTPAAGSIILVADLSCGNLRELCAVAYSEIESVRFHQGDTTITADGKKAEVAVGGSSVLVEDADITIKKGDNSVVVKSDGVVINGGDNKGLVKIDNLRKSLDSLKTYCEALKTATAQGIAAIGEITVVNDIANGIASGSAGAGAFNTAMGTTSITIDDEGGSMENKKVTH